MADPIDQGCQHEQRFTDSAINEIRNKADAIEQGVPGECIQCGEDMPRLVRRMCCRCRDKYQR
jgi:RNA polymerase-binding transcription factor DksA